MNSDRERVIQLETEVRILKESHEKHDERINEQLKQITDLISNLKHSNDAHYAHLEKRFDTASKEMRENYVHKELFKPETFVSQIEFRPIATMVQKHHDERMKALYAFIAAFFMALWAIVTK